MLDRFHDVVGGLEEATEALLAKEIKDLAGVLMPGLKRLNWNSLGLCFLPGYVGVFIYRGTLGCLFTGVQRGVNLPGY